DRRLTYDEAPLQVENNDAFFFVSADIEVHLSSHSVYRVCLTRSRQRCSFRSVHPGKRRKSDGKARSLVQLALYVNAAAVGLHNPCNEAQAQSETFFGIGGRNPIEPVEDVRQMVRRDAHSVVFHNQMDR